MDLAIALRRPVALAAKSYLFPLYEIAGTER
jgi:hypothetical protein